MFGNLKQIKINRFRDFLNSHYQWHNISKFQHLESLGLDLNNKSVLEFGAGIGDHTIYWLIKNCKVLPTDSRKELVDFIIWRLDIKAEVLDIENEIERIKKLPFFDIIYCYGTLYHIKNPGEFLDSIRGKSKMLLLETCVSDDHKPDGIYLTGENKKILTQANSGIGCRPTRRWIVKKFRENYKYVYFPKTQPKHPEFPTDWTIDYKEGKLIRAIFIASNEEIKSSMLTTELPTIYEPW